MRAPIFIAFVLTALTISSAAIAHPYPRYHRHVYPAPPPVVVVPAPPPPRVVHVVRPAPQPVIVQPAEPAYEPEYVPFGLGVRVSGVGLEGHKLFLSDVENPAMGGVGISLRSRFDEHWGLEVAADWLGGSTDDFFQSSVPITVGALLYLFPESRIQPYGIAAIGVQFTQLDYADGAFTYNMTEGIGELGLGVELALSKHFKLHTDVRFLGVYKGMGSRLEVQDACYGSGASPSICSGLDSFDPQDRFNIGVQFLGAASYYF